MKYGKYIRIFKPCMQKTQLVTNLHFSFTVIVYVDQFSASLISNNFYKPSLAVWRWQVFSNDWRRCIDIYQVSCSWRVRCRCRISQEETRTTCRIATAIRYTCWQTACPRAQQVSQQALGCIVSLRHSCCGQQFVVGTRRPSSFQGGFCHETLSKQAAVRTGGGEEDTKFSDQK